MTPPDPPRRERVYGLDDGNDRTVRPTAQRFSSSNCIDRKPSTPGSGDQDTVFFRRKSGNQSVAENYC
jgi:hypothetical protein